MTRLWILLLWLVAGGSAMADSLADHLLVVYRKDDKGSQQLAEFYAKVRSIPPERVLAIPCSANETVSRGEYENTIRGPIDAYLTGKGWLKRGRRTVRLGPREGEAIAAVKNEIWAIVLMRGVPLRIANTPRPPAENGKPAPPPSATGRDEAAVDSELSLLPILDVPTQGMVPNPYAAATMRVPRPFNAKDALNQVLVTRLDAATVADVTRMIEDSLTAERERLAGWAVIDQRGIKDPANSYIAGDQWIGQAAAAFFKAGWQVEVENTGKLLPDSAPVSDVGFYAGWYTGSSVGPFFHGPRRFVPGAVAYHLHSFSASTLRHAGGHKRAWVAPLLHYGAAASMGCVFEPFLSFTPQVGIFAQRLLSGMTFAESAYASQPVLSWMTTMVGDPLYRPFGLPLDKALAKARERNPTHAAWLALESERQKLAAEGGNRLDSNRLQAMILDAGVTYQAYESLGDLLIGNADKNPSLLQPAAQAYQEAMANVPPPMATVRIGMKLAGVMKKLGRNTEAQGVLSMITSEYPELAKLAMPETEAAKPAPSPEEDPALRAYPVTTDPPAQPAGGNKPPPTNLNTSEDVDNYLKSLIPQPATP